MSSADGPRGAAPWLKWIDRFSILLAIIGGVATVGLMVTVVIDVSGRNLFDQPLQGTLELTQFAWMPTLVSLGLGYALLRGEHVRVNLLTAPTGQLVQRIIEIVGMTFTLGVTVLFLWFGIEKAMDAMGYGEKATLTPWLLIWPYRWVLVLGLIGLLLQAVAQLLRAITVSEFTASDQDEIAAALEAEETVFDESLFDEDSASSTQATPVTTGRKDTR